MQCAMFNRQCCVLWKSNYYTCPGLAKFESHLSQGQAGIQALFFPSLVLVIHKFNGYNYVYSVWLLFSPHFGNYMFFKILYVHSTCMLMTGGNTTEESSEVPQFTIYIASMPGQYTVSEWHVYMYLQSELFPCIRCSTLYILHCTHCKPIQHWSIL